LGCIHAGVSYSAHVRASSAGHCSVLIVNG
jgi:hypothetical protein